MYDFVRKFLYFRENTEEYYFLHLYLKLKITYFYIFFYKQRNSINCIIYIYNKIEMSWKLFSDNISDSCTNSSFRATLEKYIHPYSIFH